MQIWNSGSALRERDATFFRTACCARICGGIQPPADPTDVNVRPNPALYSKSPIWDFSRIWIDASPKETMPGKMLFSEVRPATADPKP